MAIQSPSMCMRLYIDMNQIVCARFVFIFKNRIECRRQVRGDFIICFVFFFALRCVLVVRFAYCNLNMHKYLYLAWPRATDRGRYGRDRSVMTNSLLFSIYSGSSLLLFVAHSSCLQLICLIFFLFYFFPTCHECFPFRPMTVLFFHSD